ncbi:MAG: nuclear transport factor 2 family protein [Bacteroidales bacterium]|nr:nuclear transport factor 2 family protein [Bacteroidales bacterium]MCF8403068.1 nuclear transport factor 2 family protein [Bacteroidales bacterium]
MKNLFLITLSIILLSSCCDKQTKDAIVDLDLEIQKVELVLEKYVIANEKQDVDLVHDIWAAEPDIVVFGTNSDEKLIGWDAIKSAIDRQFNSFEETFISVHDQIIKINETGNTAWFSEILNYNYIYQGETMQFEGLRFTGVLEKKGDDWFIVQSHMSIPGNPD